MGAATRQVLKRSELAARGCLIRSCLLSCERCSATQPTADVAVMLEASCRSRVLHWRPMGGSSCLVSVLVPLVRFDPLVKRSEEVVSGVPFKPGDMPTA